MRLVLYSGLTMGSSEIKATEKAKPLKPRGCPSLVNFADKYIFVSGGEDLSPGLLTKEYFSSTEIYNVRRNKWRRAPRLNQPRANHSTRVAGDFLYTCCGSSGVGKINSIEAFDAASFVRGVPNIRWMTI